MTMLLLLIMRIEKMIIIMMVQNVILLRAEFADTSLTDLAYVILMIVTIARIY